MIVFAVIFLIAINEGKVNPPCDRLEPCCYGQGKPDYISHLATGEVWKYWEKVERGEDNVAGPGLFQLWHYNANDTSLFYDNTTKHTITAQSLGSLKYYVAQDRDEGLVSKEGFCWLDRMIDHLT
jgi:hypothetical protein